MEKNIQLWSMKGGCDICDTDENNPYAAVKLITFWTHELQDFYVCESCLKKALEMIKGE